MLRTVRQLLEMIRFSHTLFALPFALLAAVMAWTTPVRLALDSEFGIQDFVPFRWQHLAGILICMVGARSAAMAFNRLADRRLDAGNPRTQSRHLPAGTLSVGSVIAFTVFSSIVFIAGTLLFLPNWLPLALSFPFLLFLCGYSFSKRFTPLAHFWLGLALLLAPVSAWIALRGQILLVQPADILPAVLLGAAVLSWVAGFDIIYACQDAEFDRSMRLKSIPAALGTRGALRLAAACHFVTLLFLVALPMVCSHVPLGWIYTAGVVCIAALLVYEHMLVRPDDLARVNTAFFNVNAVISMGLLIVGTIDLLT